MISSLGSHLEVLYNGRAIATATPGDDSGTTRIDTSVMIDRSGWLALRASGKAVADVRAAQVLAHTSPVYVVIGDQPAGSVEDAQYFVGWIERLRNAVLQRGRFPDKRSQVEMEADLDAARQFYQRTVDRGQKSARLSRIGTKTASQMQWLEQFRDGWYRSRNFDRPGGLHPRAFDKGGRFQQNINDS